jgi:phage gp46-like protein
MIKGFQGDPLIKWNGGDGGDIIKNSGDYERNPGIENMINILLGTEKKVWSNVFKKNKIPGFKIVTGDVITLDDIRNIERDAENALSPMKELNIAENITVAALNPVSDTIVLSIVISEKRGKDSTYTRTWSNEFDTNN